MFGGGERLHRQGVYLLAHSIAQGRVNPLVAAHTGQALKLRRHDGGKEVPAIALHFQVFAGQARGDERADFVGCGVGHGQIVAQALKVGLQASAQLRSL